jgi:hypothetical protein
MSGWDLTKGLTNLRSQVDRRWPNRDKTSDGAISDAAHRSESSTGHSPDDTAGSNPAWDGDPDSTPEVRAWDMDSDLREPGTTAQMVVDHVRRLPNVAGVIRYIIYNRKIYHSRDGFAPAPYSGTSAHTEHIHFEGAWSQTGDNNTTFDYHLEQIGDDVSKADVTAALEEFFARGKQSDGKSVTSRIGQDALDQGVPDGLTGAKTPAWAAIKNLGAAVGKLSTLVAAMAGGAVTQADIDALKAAVDLVDEQVAERLVGATPEATAALLKPVLGDQAAEVGRILAGQ